MKYFCLRKDSKSVHQKVKIEIFITKKKMDDVIGDIFILRVSLTRPIHEKRNNLCLSQDAETQGTPQVILIKECSAYLTHCKFTHWYFILYTFSYSWWLHLYLTIQKNILRPKMRNENIFRIRIKNIRIYFSRVNLVLQLEFELKNQNK